MHIRRNYVVQKRIEFLQNINNSGKFVSAPRAIIYKTK